jgi:hypothetical protein
LFLFCFVLFCFVCLFGCCCGAWEWESFIARYVWRRRWCAGDGTLLLFFFVLFSEVEKSLNWFFFLRMGKLGSPERVVTAVWSLFFFPLWLPHLGYCVLVISTRKQEFLVVVFFLVFHADGNIRVSRELVATAVWSLFFKNSSIAAASWLIVSYSFPQGSKRL